MDRPKLELTGSRLFAAWLAQARASLAFTTYQAGKLFLVGLQPDGRLSIFERSFPRCMGLGTGPDGTLWLSSLYQLWRFENFLDPGTTKDGHDALYVPVTGYTTGDIDIHDIHAAADGRPVFVATRFNCLATIAERASFAPVWRPPFIDRLAAEDRCHLNGFVMRDGRPGFATCVAATNVAEGWREHRRDGGLVIDVASGEAVARGLSMPHSPRLYRGRLWLVQSGTGEFGYVDLTTGHFQPVCFLQGYARGLAFLGDHAVVGVSRPRENRTFEGLALNERLAREGVGPLCHLAVVSLATGDVEHRLTIDGVVEELYDVAVLPGVIRPSVIGFRMGLNLSRLDGTNGFRLDGAPYDSSGGSVAGAGDVNGDGIDDLIIGAPGADPGGRQGAGESYVVFGSAAGFAANLDLAALSGADGFRLDGIDARDTSGGSVAGAGDVNGDGIDDLIIGAPGGDPGSRQEAGESYVVFGSAAGFAARLDLAALDGTNGFRLDGNSPTDSSGTSVAGAGDINGDGIDDLIVGAQFDNDEHDTGECYVVFGSAAGFAASIDRAALDGSNGFHIDGIDSSHLSGRSVAGAGDVNGDGIDDLVISSWNFTRGESYVVFGSAAGFAATFHLAALDGSNGFHFRLDESDFEEPDVMVAGAGDVNGDGLDDVIIGDATGDPAGRNYAGESYVVFGSAAGFAARLDVAALDGSNGFRIRGIDEYDGSGASVAGAGDINGDGFDDLIIGALGADPGGNFYYGGGYGESYVVFGSAAGFAASIDLAALGGANGFRIGGIDEYDFSGGSVAGAGDVNGDGFDDLIIGAFGADPGGESYVVYGSSRLGGVNDAPIATEDLLHIDASDVVDLTADNGSGFDRDPDFDDLTVTAIDGTPVTVGNTVTLASGVRVTVLEAAEVRLDAPGVAVRDSFVYEVSDGRGGRDTAKATIIFGEPTPGPVLNAPARPGGRYLDNDGDIRFVPFPGTQYTDADGDVRFRPVGEPYYDMDGDLRYDEGHYARDPGRGGPAADSGGGQDVPTTSGGATVTDFVL